jgi:hypothetical protein
MRLLNNKGDVIYDNVHIKRCRREWDLLSYDSLPMYQSENIPMNKLISSNNLLKKTFNDIKR